MNEIKHLTRDQKEYYENRNRLLQIKYSKKLRRMKKTPVNFKNIHEVFKPKAPKVLSIVDNTEETLSYFNAFFEKFRSVKSYKCIFYFNLLEVESITIDAIMYILAILRNIKGRKAFKYSFKGNNPLNKDAKQVLEKSGFFNYVNSMNPLFIPQSENIQIKSGTNSNPNAAKEVCDFIIEKTGSNKQMTYSLYEVMIELMDNTWNHAYKDTSTLTRAWYVYVEDFSDRIEFVFLDTGAGIPKTVARKVIEQVITPLNKDSLFIKSALNGENRTVTRQSNRGNGLPHVLSTCINRDLSNMNIYSGRGLCTIDDDGTINNIDFKGNLEGTLFKWDIIKEKRGDEANEN